MQCVKLFTCFIECVFVLNKAINHTVAHRCGYQIESDQLSYEQLIYSSNQNHDRKRFCPVKSQFEKCATNITLESEL